MQRSHRSVITLLALGALVWGASTATAATPGTTDAWPDVVADVYESDAPAETFGQLSSVDQAFVVASVTAVGTEEHVTTTPSAGGPASRFAADVCFDQSASGKGTNIFGQTLYSYKTHLRYCATNGSITSAKWISRTGAASMPGWEYKGIEAGAIDHTARSIGAFSQFHFYLAPIANVPLNHQYPCLQTRVSAAGAATSSGSCSV